jgi:hypothetical protein
MRKYSGHMGKNGEPIYDLGHMGISLKLNAGKIMADIWELPKETRVDWTNCWYSITVYSVGQQKKKKTAD